MMETLEALARRMSTADDLRELVRTMKSLAAVNLRHYERSVAALADYDRTVELGLQAVLRDGPLPAPATREATGAVGAVVFGSDQGLCGGFNERIVGRFLDDLPTGKVADPAVRVLAVGARAGARLRDAGIVPEVELGVPASVGMVPWLVQDLLLLIDRWREGSATSQVVLYFHRPASAMASRPHRQLLLPIAVERLQELREAPWPTRMVPRWTLERGVLLGALVRQHLFVALHRAVTWSACSEQANRLLAMQAAERNIDERLEQLRGAYHARRQVTITTEVLDIVSGAEALTGVR
jgi:F-type H+-transporting ATPase subunit gamma